MAFTFLENALNLCIFAHAPLPHSKLQVEVFLKSVSLKSEGVEEAMICSIKIQSKDMKMNWNIDLVTFGMIVIFL